MTNDDGVGECFALNAEFETEVFENVSGDISILQKGDSRFYNAESYVVLSTHRARLVAQEMLRLADEIENSEGEE